MIINLVLNQSIDGLINLLFPSLSQFKTSVILLVVSGLVFVVVWCCVLYKSNTSHPANKYNPSWTQSQEPKVRM